MKRFALALIAVLGLSAEAAQADVYKNEKAGIQFDLPEGWKIEAEGDQATVQNADGTLGISFMVFENEDFAKAAEEVMVQVGKTLTDVKVDKEEGEAGEHNGLQTHDFSGSGKLEGEEVMWDVTLIGSKKPAIALAIAAPEAFKKDAANIQKFIDSVKPVE